MPIRSLLAAFILAVMATWVQAADLADLALPAPRMQGGRPLMEALRARASSREFSAKPLPTQLLSDLLWVAWGINRPQSGKRTAPSALNGQELDLYVVMAQGAFRYDAVTHSLKAIAAGDLRRLTGRQEFVAGAALNLIYVADAARAKTAAVEDRLLYAATLAGGISQNVYLFCASEGLATVVRASLDRKALAAALKLGEHQSILLGQSVGFPKSEGQ